MTRRTLVALLALVSALALAPAAVAQGGAVGPQLGAGALNRYVEEESFHYVTPVAVGAPYRFESTLGYLLPSGGANRRALYGCAVVGKDRFISFDPGCEGHTSLGRYGFAYVSAPAGEETVAVYRCRVPGKDHFVSRDAACEGQRTEALLGHLRVRGDALLRFIGGTHVVTAAPVGAELAYEGGLGFLLPAGGEGRRPIHSCRSGGADHFLSLDASCEGRTKLGVEGYAYDAPQPGEETVAVYRCQQPGRDHFASHDPECEGKVTEGRLGYLRRYGDALVHYQGSGTSWVTPGSVSKGYRFVRTLGFLVRVGGPNLIAIHGCLAGKEDHFLSHAPGCEGRTALGRYGFAYENAPAGEETVALYRCNGAGRGHFASLDPACEGATTESRLGYVRTTDQGPTPPPSCGPSGASVTLAFGRARPRPVKTYSFGRPATVSGRAVGADGAPAAGAAITVFADAGALTEIGRTQAAADGSFSFAVPPGSSRTLRAGFRASPADPALACSGTVQLQVRAGVTMRPVRRRVHRVVRFTGAVLGEPIPPAGKLVLLQAFDRGRWRTFKAHHTNAQGRFRAFYRFTRTFRPTTFRFRVRAPKESAFPFERATSKSVKVRVIPR